MTPTNIVNQAPPVSEAELPAQVDGWRQPKYCLSISLGEKSFKCSAGAVYEILTMQMNDAMMMIDLALSQVVDEGDKSLFGE